MKGADAAPGLQIGNYFGMGGDLMEGRALIGGVQY